MFQLHHWLLTHAYIISPEAMAQYQDLSLFDMQPHQALDVRLSNNFDRNSFYTVRPTVAFQRYNLDLSKIGFGGSLDESNATAVRAAIATMNGTSYQMKHRAYEARVNFEKLYPQVGGLGERTQRRRARGAASGGRGAAGQRAGFV